MLEWFPKIQCNCGLNIVIKYFDFHNHAFTYENTIAVVFIIEETSVLSTTNYQFCYQRSAVRRKYNQALVFLIADS